MDANGLQSTIETLMQNWPDTDEFGGLDCLRHQQITFLRSAVVSALITLQGANGNAALHEMTKLCAALQADIYTLQCQVMELEERCSQNAHDVGNLYEGVDRLTALRDTLNTVFTVEAPGEMCPHCNGTGLEPQSWLKLTCGRCAGKGTVES